MDGLSKLKRIILLELHDYFLGPAPSQKLGRAVYLHVAHHEYGASIADLAADLGCTMASITAALLTLHKKADSGDTNAVRALVVAGNACTFYRQMESCIGSEVL